MTKMTNREDNCLIIGIIIGMTIAIVCTSIVVLVL